MQESVGLKIFVFHYKPDLILTTNPEYHHLWVGKNGSGENVGFIGDDSGDNISSKNKYYSELTGLYWAWKNSKSNIVGSCHYRRYFTNVKEPITCRFIRSLYYPIGLWKKRYGLIYTRNYAFWKTKIISESEVESLLENFEAILPKRRILRYSVEEHYKRYHDINDLKRIEKILKNDYPEFIGAYQKVLKGNRLFANNVFILKDDLFNQLMQWLFSVLFKFEEQVDLKNYTGYQERIFGFLSERLITVWIEHQKINYKELPLIYFKKLKPASNA